MHWIQVVAFAASLLCMGISLSPCDGNTPSLGKVEPAPAFSPGLREYHGEGRMEQSHMLGPSGRRGVFASFKNIADTDARGKRLTWDRLFQEWLKPVPVNLQSLSSEKSIRLPMKNLPADFAAQFTPGASWSRDGNTILLRRVLEAGREGEDGDGPPELRKAMLIAYDIKRRKVYESGIVARYPLGSIGPKGKHLWIAAISERTDAWAQLPPIHVGQVGSRKFRVLDIGGVPGAFSPDGSTVPIIQPGRLRSPNAPARRRRVLLYNRETEKVRELPVSAEPPDVPHYVGGVWSQDGKMFAYSDVERHVEQVGGQQAEKWVEAVRIWDTKANKLTATLSGMVVEATGPSPTSFYCSYWKRRDGDMTSGSLRGFCLYDYHTGKTTRLGGPDTWLVTAGGNKVVFAREAKGTRQFLMANVKFRGE